MAQFIFKPGSGQPTLLWLDSVQTVGSTQQLGDRTPGEVVDPASEFLKLTRGLGEEKSGRSWTTFFPPKIVDLNRGGGSLGLAAESVPSAESQRQRFCSTNRSCKAEMESRETSNLVAGESGNVQAMPAVPADATEGTDEIFSPVCGTSEQVGSDGISGGEEVGHVRNNGLDGGHKWGRHFTLPTESWAHRSAGRRGLYFSGTAGGLGARTDQSLTEQWPRKRSTGTTMRRDCRRERLDLRSAAENQRPWTSPSNQGSKRVVCPPGSGCSPGGVDG